MIRKILLMLIVIGVATGTQAAGKAMLFIPDSSYGRVFATVTGALIARCGGSYEIMYQCENDDSIDVRIDSLAVDGFNVLIVYARETTNLRPTTARTYDSNGRVFSPRWTSGGHTHGFSCPVDVILCGLNLPHDIYAAHPQEIYSGTQAAATNWSASSAHLNWLADSMRVRTIVAAPDTFINVMVSGNKLYPATESVIAAGSSFVYDIQSIGLPTGAEYKNADLVISWHWQSVTDERIYYVPSCDGGVGIYQTGIVLALLRKYNVIDPVEWTLAMHDFAYDYVGVFATPDTMWDNTADVLDWCTANRVYISVSGDYAAPEADHVRTGEIMPDFTGLHQSKYVQFLLHTAHVYETGGSSNVSEEIFHLWGNEANETTSKIHQYLRETREEFIAAGYATDIDTTWFTPSRYNLIGTANVWAQDSIMAALAAVGVRNFLTPVGGNGYYRYPVGNNYNYYTFFNDAELAIPLANYDVGRVDTVVVNIRLVRESAAIDSWAKGWATHVVSPYVDTRAETITGLIPFYRYWARDILQVRGGKDNSATAWTLADSELWQSLDLNAPPVGIYGHQIRCGSLAAGANRGRNSFLETVQYVKSLFDAFDEYAGVTVFRSVPYKAMDETPPFRVACNNNVARGIAGSSLVRSNTPDSHVVRE